MNKGTFRRLGASICLCVLLMGQMALPAHAVKFKDVPSGFWAANEINRCVELGFFKGQRADQFGVGAPMTRASFAVVLCRFFGWKTTVPVCSSFSDVSADAWYAAEVQAAYENGVFTQQRKLFRPNEPITRGEIAVALVRALGYGPLAAVAAEDPLVLRDVYTNHGYIAMAYELGLVTGYKNKDFLPNQSATREQVAAMMIRMYNKLHATGNTMALVAKGEKLTDLTGIQTVAVSAAEISEAKTKPLFEAMNRTEEKTFIQQIHKAGKQVFLRVTGTDGALKADLTALAVPLAQWVTDRGYEGIYLDIPCKTSEIEQMAKLAAEVRTVMQGKTVCVAVDGSVRADHTADYTSLSKVADQIVIRVPVKEKTVNGMPIAVMEPMDETYAALTMLRRQIPANKLVLQITTTGSAWSGSRKCGQMMAADIQMLQQQGASVYLSEQYGAAYLRSGSTTVWYLGAVGIQARTQLAIALGAQGICLSSLNGFVN